MHRRILRRLLGERGANLVEFAIVLPVLITIVFGIVEFGFAFNTYLELRSGSREGARLAAVNNECNTSASGCAGTADAQRDALIADTRTRLTGLASSSDIGVDIIFPGEIAAPDGTTENDDDVGDDVAVCVYYQLDSVTGLFPFLNNKWLTSSAIMRIEQEATYSAGQSPPPGETSQC